MKTAPFIVFVGRIAVVPITVAILSAANGCAAVNQHFASAGTALMIKLQKSQDLADIRRDTREALAQQEEEARRIAAERDIQEARIAAERQRLEIEFCQANQEALQRQIKENLRQTVESKVAFNVEHGMQVGELEVDVEELKQLLAEREKQPVRQPTQPFRQPCSCCDQPCRCGQGMTRRQCPRCSQKSCEAEKKCGGEEMLTQLEQQPLKQPLRPAEIPMKLPVRLTFGFQQPEMESARIRRVPSVPQQPFKGPPCDRCGSTGCQCPIPCTEGAAWPYAPEVDVRNDDDMTSAKRNPPIPTPDLDVRSR